jgi:nicotinamide mononucleotide adenylyltransferase
MGTMGIFCGRLQPPIKGHQRIMDGMKYDKNYVVIIEGQASRLDPKNFLTFQERVILLKVTNPEVKAIHSTNGYLPEIIEQNKLNPDNSDVYIVAGTDRIKGYLKQFHSITKYKVFAKDIDENTNRVPGMSGTDCRKALAENDFDTYRKVVAKGLDNEKWFSWLRKKLLARLNEGYTL